MRVGKLTSLRSSERVQVFQPGSAHIVVLNTVLKMFFYKETGS